MKTNTNRNYAKLVLTILAAWLGTAIAASTLLVFHAGSRYAFHPPVPLGLAVTLPILIFVLWYATSPGFREFVLIFEPAESDDCANVAHRRHDVCSSLRLWNSARSFRAPRGVGRCRHRDHSAVRGNLSCWQC